MDPNENSTTWHVSIWKYKYIWFIQNKSSIMTCGHWSTNQVSYKLELSTWNLISLKSPRQPFSLTFQHPFALLLRFVSMDTRYGPAVSLHASRQIVRFALRFNKDQRLVLFLIGHVFQEFLQSVNEKKNGRSFQKTGDRYV